VFETFVHWGDITDDVVPTLVMGAQLQRACQYLVYQFEQCPNTGRTHIQGFWIGKEKLRFSQVQKLLGAPTAHFEKMAGKPDQARGYCMIKPFK